MNWEREQVAIILVEEETLCPTRKTYNTSKAMEEDLRLLLLTTRRALLEEGMQWLGEETM